MFVHLFIDQAYGARGQASVDRAHHFLWNQSPGVRSAAAVHHLQSLETRASVCLVMQYTVARSTPRVVLISACVDVFTLLLFACLTTQC